jgi:hypothetical protein
MENMKIPLVLAGAVAAQIIAGTYYLTNVLRDVEENTDYIHEMIDVIAEVQEESDDGDISIRSDLDKNTVKLIQDYYTQMIKLEGRINTLESTFKYMNDQGR